MKEKIEIELKDIEQQLNVSVLYACEAGSRCWGIESEDSDYDVRFIYRHASGWYLRLNRSRDVISRARGELDISGWDVRKALRLFKKSNPPMLEWLHSPTVYMQDEGFVEALCDLIPYYYNPTAASYHYYHMAKGNYREYLRGDEIWLKKYLYVIRPLLCVLWIEATGELPPVSFESLLNSSEFRLLSSLYEAIITLLRDKREGGEMGLGPRVPVISDFVEGQLDRMEVLRFSGQPETKDWDLLNALFVGTIFKEFPDE